MVLDQHDHAGRNTTAGLAMTRPRRTEDVVYALIRQALDDAHLHLCAADAMTRGGSIVEAIQRAERAASAYEESKTEFLSQCEVMGHRRRGDVDRDLNELCRRLWTTVATLSVVAKTNIVVYNQLRSLRRSFLILGGIPSRKAQAIGG